MYGPPRPYVPVGADRAGGFSPYAVEARWLRLQRVGMRSAVGQRSVGGVVVVKRLVGVPVG